MEAISEFFSDNFLEIENYLSIDLRTAVFCLLGALISGLIIYTVYKYFYRGIAYNENFNILLVMFSILTAFIVMVIGTNILLSLATVGAFSLIRVIRVRTAVKDPLDIAFLFWSLAVGIASGVMLYKIAFFATIAIAVIYILLSKLIRTKTLYLLIVSYDKSAENNILKKLSNIKYKIKNKSESSKETELIIQFSLKKEELDFTGMISKINGVKNVSMVEYDGFYDQ